MKIAFSTWNQRISPVFDVSRKALVIEVEDGKVVSDLSELPMDPDPLRKVENLRGLEVGALVCGAISRCLWRKAVAAGITVIPFIAGDLDEVVEAYLRGELPRRDLAMPGCCRGRVQPFWLERRTDMPQGDGTGPQGKGPGTGRGRGGCGGQGGRGKGGGQGGKRPSGGGAGGGGQGRGGGPGGR